MRRETFIKGAQIGLIKARVEPGCRSLLTENVRYASDFLGVGSEFVSLMRHYILIRFEAVGPLARVILNHREVLQAKDETRLKVPRLLGAADVLNFETDATEPAVLTIDIFGWEVSDSAMEAWRKQLDELTTHGEDVVARWIDSLPEPNKLAT